MPDDVEAGDFQAPDSYSYVGTPAATAWHFSGSEAGGTDFEAGEWSLVFYRAVASDWTHVDATVGPGAGGDHVLPGAGKHRPADRWRLSARRTQEIIEPTIVITVLQCRKQALSVCFFYANKVESY